MAAPADASSPAPDRTLRRKSLVGAAILVTACLLLSSGCSSSGNGKASTSTPNTASATSSSAAAPSSAASSTAASSPAAEDKIAGTWNGTFTGGTSSGMFKVVFTQQGETIAGNITITGNGGNAQGPIRGKLTGSNITFGAVGGTAISFTGSFSGNSMSGTYRSGTDTGTWKATR
jgi:hypothetical protein